MRSAPSAAGADARASKPATIRNAPTRRMRPAIPTTSASQLPTVSTLSSRERFQLVRGRDLPGRGELRGRFAQSADQGSGQRVVVAGRQQREDLAPPDRVLDPADRDAAVLADQQAR